MDWYWYAIISAVTIAAVGLLQKKTLEREHSLEYATIFTLIKLVMLLAVFGSTIDWTINSTNLIVTGVAGVTYALAFLSIAKSMRRLELSTVMPVLSLEPALVAVLALVVLSETLTGAHVLGLVLTLIGTYVLELRRHTEEAHHLVVPFQRLLKDRGGRFALWGLAFFTLSSVIDRFMLQRIGVTTYIAYVLIVSLAVFCLMWFVSEEKPELFQRDRRWVLPIIILIAALHLTSNLTQAKAISLAAVGLVIAVKRTAALIDVAVGGRMFHEHHMVQKVLASIIILTGVYFIVAP